MARLNDTVGLRRMGDGEEHSISTRKIDNGYVTRRSSYNPGTGDYSCKEEYSKNAPSLGTLGAETSGFDAAGSSGLSGVKKYLNP